MHANIEFKVARLPGADDGKHKACFRQPLLFLGGSVVVQSSVVAFLATGPSIVCGPDWMERLVEGEIKLDGISLERSTSRGLRNCLYAI